MAKSKKKQKEKRCKERYESSLSYDRTAKTVHSEESQPSGGAPFFGLPPVKCLNESQKKLVTGIKEKDVVIASGSSGVGKTYTALLQALNIIKSSDEVNRIVLVKSVTVVSGEDIGYLPGSMEEKMDHFLCSFYGNIDKIYGKKDRHKDLLKAGVLEIAPLAYVRGVNIDNAIVIIDELQNLTPELFKTIITRIGKNSKYIFLGDPEQNDRKKKSEGCMRRVMEAFENSELVSVVEFDDKECVRNPIIPEILKTLRENDL